MSMTLAPCSQCMLSLLVAAPDHTHKDCAPSLLDASQAGTWWTSLWIWSVGHNVMLPGWPIQLLLLSPHHNMHCSSAPGEVWQYMVHCTETTQISAGRDFPQVENSVLFDQLIENPSNHVFQKAHFQWLSFTPTAPQLDLVYELGPYWLQSPKHNSGSRWPEEKGERRVSGYGIYGNTKEAESL